MKPMDFEEFLLANSIDEKIIDNLYDFVKERRKIPSFVHDKLIDLFNRYICIGGMPEVVDAYIKTNNFTEVRKVQKRLLMSF